MVGTDFVVRIDVNDEIQQVFTSFFGLFAFRQLVEDVVNLPLLVLRQFVQVRQQLFGLLLGQIE